MTVVDVKRIYDPSRDGGFRVLIDRLWPRGVARGDASVDLWAKLLTPSDDLRRWLHQHPEGDVRREQDFEEFAARYRAELDAAPVGDVLDALRRHEHVTLLTAVKDPDHSHVTVLLNWLAEHGFITS